MTCAFFAMLVFASISILAGTVRIHDYIDVVTDNKAGQTEYKTIYLDVPDDCELTDVYVSYSGSTIRQGPPGSTIKLILTCERFSGRQAQIRVVIQYSSSGIRQTRIDFDAVGTYSYKY